MPSMSKRSSKIDTRQRQLDFDWSQRVESHLADKTELLEAAGAKGAEPKPMESYEEACIELAVALKKALRQWGQGRLELVKAVNTYFGWDPDGEGKSLSIHMLNHYLSKPAEYPIPGAMLFAIHHINGSLEPCRCLAEAEGGEVISQEDKRTLMLGKMESAVWELNRLKRELRNGKVK